MPFTIPNEADAGNANQAEWDKVDLDFLTEAVKGNGVVAGCAVTAQGTPDMTVAVAAGLIVFDKKTAQVTAGNVTIAAADGTNPRFDLIVVDNAGAKSVVQGTAAAEPVFPALPASRVILAAVYVPANDTAINSNQITDKRFSVAGFVHIRKGADESVTSSTTLQDDDDLKFEADASSKWEVELNLFVEGDGANDFKYAFSTPSGTTGIFGGHALITGATGTSGDMAAGCSTTLTTVQTSHAPSATQVLVKVVLSIEISTTAGTVVLQWAQNSSSATATKVKAGSTLKARRLP